MKKILLAVLITLVISAPTMALTQQETEQLTIGTLISEHLDSKGCDPLEKLVITAGISIVKELFDTDGFKLKDIGFTCSGIIVSYSVDELTDFILSGIEFVSKEPPKS